MGERVLVTGGAGFIGSHTVDRLLAAGHQVRILDNLDPETHPDGLPSWVSDEVEFILGDVRDYGLMRKALQGVDFLFHMAAYQGYHHDFSTFFDVNVTGTARIFELLHRERLSLRKVVITSSQFVQGEGLYRDSRGEIRRPGFRSRKGLEAGEWDHLDDDGVPMQPVPTGPECSSPANAYSLSKRAQEETALVLGRRYGVPVTALRYSIVQGSRQSYHSPYSGVCRIFALSYLAGVAPAIFEDGRQLRDFVNVADVVSANLLAMENGPTDDRVYCVGGGTPISILEFDRLVAAEFDSTELEPNIPGIFRFGDMRHAISDITPLMELGWSPEHSIAESIHDYAEWIRRSSVDPARLGAVAREMEESGIIRQVGTKGQVPEGSPSIRTDGSIQSNEK